MLARAVRARGHAAAFAYGGAHGPLLDQAGFESFPVAEVAVAGFDANVYALYTRDLVERAIEDERAAIDAFEPDVVIADFRPTAALSAPASGRPLVQVLNHCFTRAFDLAAVLIDRTRHRWRYRSARPVVRAIQAWQRRGLARVLARAARRRGLPHRDLFDFFQGDLELVADVPAFVGQEGAGPRARFVGPLAWDGPEAELPAEALAAGDGRTVLYATSGNTGSAAVLDAVADAFGARDDRRLLMTTGAYGAPERYAGLPAARAFRFLPGSAAAAAAAAVIHCGGSGTTYQCLRAGTPAVVVPGNNEQRLNARLVARHGVGVALETADPERLRRAVGRVLEDPGYRERARRFAERMQGWYGPERAIAALEELATKAG